MIKAIDDTWEYLSGAWPENVFRKGTNAKIVDVWADGIENHHEAADLIAAAPEMARLLLDMRGAELLPGSMEDRLVAVLRKAGVLT